MNSVLTAVAVNYGMIGLRTLQKYHGDANRQKLLAKMVAYGFNPKYAEAMNFFNKSNIKSVQATKVDDIKEKEVLNEDVINTVREFQAMKQDFKHGHFGFKYDVEDAAKKYNINNDANRITFVTPDVEM